MELFSKKDRKIDFITVGTQKGGTSALDYYLRKHPDIGMADSKELHFFDNEKIFSKPWINYRRLTKHFHFTNGKTVYGETTPNYMYWTPSIRRIWEYNNRMKLIIILRNPIYRAFSHWNMQLRRKNRNREVNDFWYCIKNERSRIKEALPFQHRGYSYVDRGFYSEQIRRILRFFKPKQLAFIKYDDFIQSQKLTLTRVFEFLGVDPDNYHFKKNKVHSIPYKRDITRREKEYLIDLYFNDISEVERILHWDCSEWKRSAVSTG